MNARIHLANPRRIGLRWLIALALLVPLAQAAATWHVLSHLRQESTLRDGDSAPAHSAGCELCFAGAAVDAGGLPCALVQVVTPPLDATYTAAADTTHRSAARAAAYRSRAPPHPCA